MHRPHAMPDQYAHGAQFPAEKGKQPDRGTTAGKHLPGGPGGIIALIELILSWPSIKTVRYVLPENYKG